MFLEKLYIRPSSKTLEILLDPGGYIKISGRGLISHNSEVTEQVMDWLNSYITNPADITYVILAFEYLNSYNTTIIVSLLRKITEVQTKSKKLVVRWLYENGDDDIHERGQYIAAVMDISIEYIMIRRNTGE